MRGGGTWFQASRQPLVLHPIVQLNPLHVCPPTFQPFQSANSRCRLQLQPWLGQGVEALALAVILQRSVHVPLRQRHPEQTTLQSMFLEQSDTQVGIHSVVAIE